MPACAGMTAAQIIYSLICLIGFISLIGSIGCIDLSVGTTEYLLFAQPN
jgi:hypothetical protein